MLPERLRKQLCRETINERVWDRPRLHVYCTTYCFFCNSLCSIARHVFQDNNPGRKQRPPPPRFCFLYIESVFFANVDMTINLDLKRDR